MEKAFTFDYEMNIGSMFKREGRRYRVDQCIEDIDYDGMWHCQCEDVTDDADIKEYEDYIKKNTEINERIDDLKNQINLLASGRTLDIYDFVNAVLADETTEIVLNYLNQGKHLCSFGSYPSPDYVTFYNYDNYIYMVYCKDGIRTYYRFNDITHMDELNNYIEEQTRFITNYNLLEKEIKELRNR
jgi:hypothetical protein